MAEFKIGDRVRCEKGIGVVAHFGDTKFADDIWVGIILDEPNGKNNGTVKGEKYFECEENHGTFVKPNTVQLEGATSGRPTASGLPKPTSRKSNLTKPSSTSVRSSPSITPKMSPAVSMEQLQKTSARGDGAKGAQKDAPPRQLRVPSSTRISLKTISEKPTKPAAVPQTIVEKSPQPEPKAPVQKQQSVEQKQVEQQLPEPMTSTPASTTNVKDLALKLSKESTPIKSSESSTLTPQHSIDNNNSAEADARVQVLTAEIGDLNTKLENLRQRREEDKEKIKELDRVRLAYQTLAEFKTVVLEEQRQLRIKLEDTESRLAQSEAKARQMEHEMSNNTAEELEMVTLDKLVAEERAENLQAELEDQKDKILALESELALIKSGVTARNTSIILDSSNNQLVDATMENLEDGGVDTTNLTADTLNNVSIQIENYKNALIKMRDIVTTANFERNDMQQQYEQCRAEYQRLQTENDKLLNELSQVYDEVTGLHEQLDAAMGSTRMVEYLTERNLDLEDKLRTITDEKEHLEELVQLNEEIAETARESQLDLRKECDEYIVRLSERNGEVEQLENQIAQYDNIVQKYRQKTVDLNNEIVDYKDKIHILEHQLNEHNATGAANVTALFSSARSFADLINAELNQLDLKFSNEYSKYLRIFLPDNFSKAGGDLDCILLIIFFPRIAAKSDLLARLLSERFPNVPDGMQREHVVKSNKAEQWANVRKFHYHLRVLSAVARRFETMSLNCTIESLTRLALQRTEITNQERLIDQYFDSLKNNLFDENTSTDMLIRASSLLQKIFAVNVSATEYDTRKAFVDYLQQFIDGLQWIRFNCERIKFFVFPAELEDESVSNSFIEFLNELISNAERSESQLMRAQKWIPSDKMLNLSHDMLDIVFNGFALTEKVATILHDTSALAVSQLVTNDVDGFATSEFMEFLQSVVEKREGHKTANEAVHEVRTSMQALISCIDEIGEKLERKQFEVPLMIERPNPLVERSQTQKRDEADAENLRWEITKKDESIGQLAKALKSLEDNISFLKIQVEREKNKNSKMGQKDSGAAASSEQIQEALIKAKQKHDQEMEDLSQKIVDLEKQLTEKDKQVKRIVRKSDASALLDPSSYAFGSDRTNFMGEGHANGRNIPQISGFQQTPAEMLQSLHWAHEKVRRLQAELDSRQLFELKPLNVPTQNVAGVETLRLRNHASSANADQIELQHKSLFDESNILLLESKKLASISLNKRNTDSYRRQLNDYNKRVIDLRLRTRAFASRNYPQIPLPPQFHTDDSIPSAETTKTDAKVKPSKLQSVFEEKMARLQASVTCRKQLLSSMKNGINQCEKAI